MLTPKGLTTATKGKIGKNHEQRYPAVLMKLDWAITFCAMGNTDRNIENAKREYSDGIRFLFNADLSSEARRELIDKLAVLQIKICGFDQQMGAPGVQFQKAHGSAHRVSEGDRQ